MGYAKLRPRPSSGNSRGSVLKPAKKKSYIVVWVGVIMLLLVAAVVIVGFCLLRGGWAINPTDRSHTEDEHFVAGENNTKVQEGIYDELDFGDYSDLQDARFCRQHGIDTAEVSTEYDKYRRADVYSGTSKPQRIEVPDIRCTTIMKYVECSNKIVERDEICVMTVEGDKGSVEFQRGCRKIAAAVVAELLSLSTLSSKGCRIVASSPNIEYRGYNKERIEDSLMGALKEAIGSQYGVVAIQWETPNCFIALIFLEKKGVCTVIKSMSDQIIRSDVFGNE